MLIFEWIGNTEFRGFLLHFRGTVRSFVRLVGREVRVNRALEDLRSEDYRIESLCEKCQVATIEVE